MTEPLTFFVSFMVSLVGLALFIYGKRQKRLPQVMAGLLLMVFPYFVSSLWLLLGVAVGIGALTVIAVRSGL
jgi:apolipoprotein N-acyltransferase